MRYAILEKLEIPSSNPSSWTPMSSDTPPKVGILGQNFRGTSSLQFNLATPYVNRCVSAVNQPAGLLLQSLKSCTNSNVQRLPVHVLFYTQTIAYSPSVQFYARMG